VPFSDDLAFPAANAGAQSEMQTFWCKDCNTTQPSLWGYSADPLDTGPEFGQTAANGTGSVSGRAI